MLFRVFLLLLSLSTFGFGQSNLDSLKRVASEHENDSVRVMANFNLILMFNRMNYDSAMHYAQQAKQLAEELRNLELHAQAHYRLATVHIVKGNYDKAELELDSSMQLAKVGNDEKGQLRATTEMGRLYMITSNFDDAITTFRSARELAKKLGDKNAEARIYNYLGTVFNDQKVYDDAVASYKSALRLVIELNFKPGISAILNNLGALYSTMGQYDSAFSYNMRSLEIKQEMGDQLGIGRVYQNLGNVMVDTNKIDSALLYYDKGLVIANSIDDNQLRSELLYGKLKCFYLLKRTSDALLTADKLLNILQDKEYTAQKVLAFDLIAKLNADQGNYEKAWSFQHQSKAMADTLYNQEQIRLTRELESKYANKEKQRTIELLEASNRLQELQVEQSKSERNVLIVFVVVVLIMLGLVYNQFRLKQKANAQLKSLDRMKSVFFENLSHEFRTPLSLIMAPAKDKLNQLTGEDDREIFRLIHQNAEHLDELISQLLDLAKLEKGRYEINPTAVESVHLFKAITSSYHSLANYREIKFEVDIPNEARWLMLDKDLVRKICNNLLSNAFKFTPKTGSIHFLLRFNDAIKITVSDTGEGIATDEQSMIFERFYQAGDKRASGSGIGLALTKELIEVAGGTIKLESKVGQGSTFYVTLPLIQTEAITADAIEMEMTQEMIEDVEERSLSNEKKTILLVEDNQDLRKYVAGLFQTDFNILRAKNGQEGIDLANESIPDLVISDIMMDEMDGIQLCEQLKTDVRTDHIPVILLTARADQQTRFTGLKTGADAYILKPFDPEELRLVVNNLIQQREALKVKYTSLNGVDRLATTHPFIEKCEAIIQNQLSNNELSADDFSHEVGMSRMQVHRKLKALTGLSATAFIRQYRLKTARQLLEKGESVAQVAYAVGFSSPAYFTRSFKSTFGIIPSEIPDKSA